MNIGIIGSGAMGNGIAQVAAMAGHKVVVYDNNTAALDKAKAATEKALQKLAEKGKITDAAELFARYTYVNNLEELKDSGLVIEAIIEQLDIKKSVFAQLETIVSEACILASNTSSLSIASIAAACKKADRVIGIHFFNPAPVMALVEIIPAIQTREGLAQEIKELMLAWKKVPVLTKDTPGFIVNRVARPFYGEAIRIMEEGLAGKEDIDLALTQLGGFKMGPFTLTDYIGHDVNYVVTETVFQSFYYDPKYRPAFAQKRLLEAGWLGRKSGKGFYNYENGEPVLTTALNEVEQKTIVERILFMLINEAVEALYLNIASAADLDLAMTKGVNYPKGLLQWCDELGADYVLAGMDALYKTYHDDRYRASALLRKYGTEKRKFFN
ncbi:3-hydroxybutyryl-CoA dehydrogenase [Taibaiella sp. KBW10]|uniref:3-hydroxyacyl-CoA dehydrogenase NAD-binding domain-containing protein n=1 Tax=Taibaiella sp. KBW10 TaxID=2153357 RepID=UPI000F5A7D08|nr:3-hydroxyacyl-CoA dehydrogenase NAD-binding domain-containing protein [Taibaiella sp. KBW10]RQO31771.1 3-hydroxybutyryl-CoA dehydrogenase [Taibaiella sp. KBW10]